MKDERQLLVEQVLGQYSALGCVLSGLGTDDGHALTDLLADLPIGDLRTVAAAFTILASAAPHD